MRHTAARAGDGETGFTLIEVLLASSIFIVVALAGFEAVRGVGHDALALAVRARSAAALATAVGRLRSDALAASAVWTPAAACGDAAVSMLRRDAAGMSFTTYTVHAGTLLRTSAAGPVDPCAGMNGAETVLGAVTGATVAALAAPALSAHADAHTGAADGTFFRAAGIAGVAVDAHVRDFDGAPVSTGNGIVELTLDADPSSVTVDLLAGNRPSGYVLALTYACGPRCAANAPTSAGGFPELRTLDATTCTALPPDLPDTSAYYAPLATGVSAAGHLVTTQYQVHLRFRYTFGGGTSPPLTVDRIGPTYAWPVAGGLADPYPVDYSNNAVRSTGAVALDAQFGPPASLAATTALCASMNGETDYRG